MKKPIQKGFALLELMIFLAIATVIVFVGMKVLDNRKNTQGSSVGSSGTSDVTLESTSAAVIPTIIDASDLDRASAALDQNDNSADDSHDSSSLNTQSDF